MWHSSAAAAEAAGQVHHQAATLRPAHRPRPRLLPRARRQCPPPERRRTTILPKAMNSKVPVSPAEALRTFGACATTRVIIRRSGLPTPKERQAIQPRQLTTHSRPQAAFCRSRPGRHLQIHLQVKTTPEAAVSLTYRDS